MRLATAIQSTLLMSSSDALSDVDARVTAAQSLLQIGQPDQAEAELVNTVRAYPQNFRAWLTLGLLYQHLGKGAEAVTAYDRAIAIRPGDATVFTRRGLLLLRHHLGPPPAPRLSDNSLSAVSFTALGGEGRFGNQLLQYAALRLYATRAGAQAECPDWIGRDLFDLDDPMPTSSMPRRSEEEFDLLTGPAAPGVDLFGYFCGPWASVADKRDVVRNFFRPGVRLAETLDKVEATVRMGAGTLVALHLRRGDFGYGKFWIAPEDWYLQWLADVWPTLDRPVLYVATDAPALIEQFSNFNPLSAKDLNIQVPGAEFLPDFHILRCADVVAVSNSTFSVSAAMLNETAQIFMRPDTAHRALRPFYPWLEPILLTQTP